MNFRISNGGAKETQLAMDITCEIDIHNISPFASNKSLLYQEILQ